MFVPDSFCSACRYAQNFHVNHGNSGLNFFKHLGLRSRVKSTARGEICQFDGLIFLP